MIAANVSKATNSFGKGQLVYIYGGYWGMAERLKVIGRYRGKHRFIKGVCSIVNLVNHRPKIVCNPEIIRKCQGEKITRSSILNFRYS
ncbi:hypothetical protein [Candidatus Uabimicrobium sp. HlEnr_7]|uniref:hypothetical protein n=1 Tax=Candidatus Uabimicrobium helgolandensis TaxID=3095367 RepID=UPI003558A1D8